MPAPRLPRTNCSSSKSEDSTDSFTTFPELECEPIEDPDFEYHIEFPKPDSPRVWSDAVGLGANDDVKDPVVILLGWAGAQDKYLAKYSDLYLERGCIILRYIAPLKSLFLDTSNLAEVASKLISLLKDFQLDSHPIFFHAFSNGGGFTYSFILRELAIHHETLDIRGTIFDSAPAPRDLKTCHKALVSIFEPAYGKFASWIMASFSVLIIILSVFWYHGTTAFRFCCRGDHVSEKGGIIPRDEPPSQNWLSRISQMKKHNFLFIYSDADDLIKSDKIEEFANILVKGDNRIKYLKFKDSPHVQHFRSYPKEYVKSIEDFIRGVMMRGTNETKISDDY